jgi:hypothetical protein
MDKQIYIQDVPSIELGGQTYTPSDNSLIASFRADITFNSSTDYIEYFVYSANKQIIDSVERLTSFAIYGEDLSINPEKDLESRAYQEGQYYTVYNFLRPLLSSSILEPYYISEISTDRTEIRLASTDIVAGDIVDSTVALKAAIEAAPFQKDFNLDFGANSLIIANNVLLDDTDPSNVTVLVKLYEPLPAQFDIESKCWGVEKIAESKAYLINIKTSYTVEDGTIRLKGPNVNLQVAQELNKTTEYQNSQTLSTSDSSALSYQLNSLLAESGIELNIDYSNYGNFVFFSSAQTRLENFYYKLGLIEEYTVSSSYGSTSNAYYNSSSVSYWDSKINEVITNFDGYEYYLYYESGSTAWPKTNSVPPYTNTATTSTLGLNWFVSQSAVAQTFDENNKDGLVEAIPMYIKEDSANANFELFVEMVGQHFDSIWVYTQAVTQKYSSDNRVESGLSKDLVGTALKDFGIKLYQNNFTSDNLYSTYLGYTPSGSLLPYTGQELITTYVTASATGSLIPLDNLSSEVYKRLYHNLPYLLKKKGTVEGLNTLITTFGIPDTILRVYEYGGKDKALNTWDQWQNEYNYAFDTKGTNYVTSSFVINSNWNADNNRPQAVEFRFQTRGIPTTTGYYSQSLWSTDSGSALILKYNGTANTSGSYTGSIVSPYNQYGTLEFYPDTTSTSATASVYLPFFNEGWWSVLINKSGSTGFTLYAKNNLYQGQDGNTLGFQGSSSISLSNAWNVSTKSYFGSASFSAKVFSGSLQELRYYKAALSESSFNDYVMNASSTEGNSVNSAPDQLVFRATLGGELYTSSISIHPKVTGSQATTSSFSGTSDFCFVNAPTFVPNTEITFYDQPAVGIKNAVSDKIKVGTTDLYGTVLSGLNTLQQNNIVSQSYTRDVNYLEVGFSPQNEINEDINSQIGFFNIGEYIGDPRTISDDNYKYPALDQVNTEYFKKYTTSYNYTDYLRLIKFFDNSLFKLIKDFIPARTGAATGAIVKQHLLERNRQRPAQVDYTQPEYTGSVTSLARDYQTGSIEVFTGGPGGSVDTWLNISQSWSSSIDTKAGIVNQINSSEYEFYNGEYSGSTIDVVRGNLQDNPLLAPAFAVSIPDQQNLNVGRSTNYSGISASFGNPMTGTLPFNLEIKEISAYNNTTYEYTTLYSVQSDIEILITGSFLNTTATEDSQLTIYLKEDGQILATGFDDNGSNNDLNITLTVPNLAIKAGSVYKVDFYYNENDNVSPSTARIDTGSYWTATVDNLYAQSTYYLDPTVYTQQNFPGNINQYSDYNAIYNNVYSNRVSSLYYDVDYNGDALNPTNFTTIVSQSAIYAQIQDSNYATGSTWNKGRYEGTKLQTYDNQPAANNYTDYFLYFSNITAQTPDLSLIPYGGNVRGVALISIDGDVISLTPDNQNVGLVKQIFGVFDTVKAIFPAQYLGTDVSDLTLTVIIAGGVQNYLETSNILTSTPNETNIFLGVVDSYPASISTLNTLIFSDSAGYLIPANFNINYLSKISDIAKQAGFPIN